MKHIKKYIALFLSFSVLLCTPVMAASQPETSIMETQMQAEVRIMVRDRLEEVQHLFEGKDSGYLNAYTEYLTAFYEQLVLKEHGIVPLYEEEYRLDNGGSVSYTTIDAAGDHFDVVVLMFDKEDSYDFLLENWSPGSVNLGDLFISAVGYIPGIGTIAGAMFDILDGVSALCGSGEWEMIQDADGYVMAEVVHARDYPGDPVTMIRGWDTHPYYVPWSTFPEDLEINVFEFD